MEGDTSKIKCTCANFFRVRACKSDIHACICGESLRTCIAKEHVCRCYSKPDDVIINNNNHCKSRNHVCVCSNEYTKCRASDHKCIGGYYYTKYCRSTKEHVGQCALGITPEQIRTGAPSPLYMRYCIDNCKCWVSDGPSGCRCVIHTCVCPVARCRSVYHECKCNDDAAKQCLAQIHHCICSRKDGRACLSESHVCTCTNTKTNEGCRSQYHICTCTKTKTNDGCRSHNHFCTCKMVIPGNMFPYIDSRLCRSRDGHTYFSEPSLEQTVGDLISFD